MKLFRFGPRGAERPGIVAPDGSHRDLSGQCADFEREGVSLAALRAIAQIDPYSLPLADSNARIGAPLADVPNFFCIGMNYAKHAAETGMQPPAEPVIFAKATSCLSGPYDPVIIPRGSDKTDWEVELAIVIGKTAFNVQEADAMGYIAGFCIANDVSERDFQQIHGGQWGRGKSAPSFGPIGPYLVTPDSVGNVSALDLWLSVDGVEQQRSNTGDMIFSVPQIIAAMSRFMTLRVGDIIATGTPSGVGMGQNPPQFLRAGQVMTLGIDGLGEQRLVTIDA